jgi:hypothetical protein
MSRWPTASTVSASSVRSGPVSSSVARPCTADQASRSAPGRSCAARPPRRPARRARRRAAGTASGHPVPARPGRRRGAGRRSR